MMKKTGQIICYIFASLIIIFSFIFVFLEARNLFSGDWLMYENKIDGFIRYLFRLIYALFTLSFGIFTFFALSKKANSTLRIYYFLGSLTLLITSLVIASFSSNYINVAIIVLAIGYFIGACLYALGIYLFNNKDKSV